MRKRMSTVLLTIALTAPVAVFAQDEHHDDNQHHRFYDKSHKEYHEWNDNEDKAWRQYLNEHHRAYTDFGKASKRRQEAYWKWRHDHPDHS